MEMKVLVYTVIAPEDSERASFFNLCCNHERGIIGHEYSWKLVGKMNAVIIFLHDQRFFVARVLE